MSQLGNRVHGKKQDYELLDLVKGGTHGNMGSVYKARGLKDGEIYALKTPSKFNEFGRRHVPKTYKWIHDKLKEEAKALRILNSKKRVTSILQYIDESNNPDLRTITDDRGKMNYDSDFFLVMELIDGQSLGSYITDKGRLDQDSVVDIAKQLTMVTDIIHKAGIIHRDLKPDNMMIRNDSAKTIVLIDFGTAKVLGHEAGPNPSAGSVVGSPAYSCHHQPLISHAPCDIYAVWRSVFNLITDCIPTQFTETEDDAGMPLKSNHPDYKNHVAPVINQNGKVLLDNHCSPEFKNLLLIMLDPDHDHGKDKKQVIKELLKIPKTYESVEPQRIVGKQKPPPPPNKPRRMSGAVPAPQPVPQPALAPYIQFSGPIGVSGRYDIPDGQYMNTVIGGNHNINQCKAQIVDLQNSGDLHCNLSSDGTNIPIGKATCPSKNCQGCDNLAHFVPRHHMRIWKNRLGQRKIGVNSDEAGGIKRANDTFWTPIPPKTSTPLNDNDEIAVLYVEPPSSIPITFTFHGQ